MSREAPLDVGLESGRQWSTRSADAGPIEWSIDPDVGYVQGPLDMEFLRGQKLSLNLAEGQQALLVEAGQLKAVYLDGMHYLDVGTGRRQVSPACQLIFLALDKPLQLHWSHAQPLRWGAAPGQALIGNCQLRIEGPRRFYETFLQGHPNPDPGFTVRLIDQLICSLFGDRLGGDEGDHVTLTDAEVQARLTGLTPADLNEDLDACGLNCLRLAVYTDAPPIEDGPSRDMESRRTVPH